MKHLVLPVWLLFVAFLAITNACEKSTTGDNSSTGSNPTALGEKTPMVQTHNQETEQNNQPSREKKYAIDQIKLTDTDGVTISTEQDYLESLNENGRDQMKNSFGGITPSVYFVQFLSVNGKQGGVSYCEFSNSTEATSACQKYIQSKPTAKAISHGNYVIKFSSNDNDFANILINKIKLK